MVSATTVLEPRARASERWRSLSEFLVIGGATLLLIPVAWWYQQTAGLDESQYVVSFLAFYAAFVINDPHFAVTYLLFYKDARRRAFGGGFTGLQRWRYLIAGFLVPAGLLVWVAFALASNSAQTMGWLIQLMFFLVSWHYVKQGFGVLTVLSARRGIRFTPLERRFVLAHCFAGWAYAWSSPAGPGFLVEESGVVYLSMAQPVLLEQVSRVAFFGSAVAMSWALWRKWRREGALPLAPLGGLLITVWLWSVYSDFDPLIAYLIPGLHSLQYLYFVWLLKRNQAREALSGECFIPVRRRLVLLAISALALGWFLFRGGPQFFDAHLVLNDPDLAGGLGPTPYLAAFLTFVNIHHYFMDHVIWRRENPETRYLMG